VNFKVVTGVTLNTRFMQDILKTVGAELIQLTLKNEADVIEHAADADGVIVGLEPYTKKAIEAMGRCKIISRTGVGYSNIDVDAATRQGIPVAIAMGSNMYEVSDYAVACILAFNRKLFPLAQAVRSGVWRGGSQSLVKARGNMRRLSQQTLGLIGMGRIGSLVVQKVKGFGMRVLVFDPYVSADVARKLGAEAADFETVLSQSDYISLHAPLTSETKHLLGLPEFKKMKPSAYLINAARGGLIDEKALHQAITEGIIAGAALDVTDPEPPDPDNPLLNLDQVLVTGHSSWCSDMSISEGQSMAAEAVVQALRGIWPSYLVNPEVKQQKNARIG
jgi:D-3-phosphoglycerate dehydrogenase / 2-oxoglutarate reductase